MHMHMNGGGCAWITMLTSLCGDYDERSDGLAPSLLSAPLLLTINDESPRQTPEQLLPQRRLSEDDLDSCQVSQPVKGNLPHRLTTLLLGNRNSFLECWNCFNQPTAAFAPTALLIQEGIQVRHSEIYIKTRAEAGGGQLVQTVEVTRPFRGSSVSH